MLRSGSDTANEPPLSGVTETCQWRGFSGSDLLWVRRPAGVERFLGALEWRPPVRRPDFLTKLVIDSKSGCNAVLSPAFS